LNLGKRFLGPRDQDLVSVRQALARGEASAGIRDDRVPAESVRGCAERVGRIDRAVDEQSWRGPEHVGENARAFELDDFAVPAPDQLVRDLVLAVANEALCACIEVDQSNGATFATHDPGELFEE